MGVATLKTGDQNCNEKQDASPILHQGHSLNGVIFHLRLHQVQNVKQQSQAGLKSIPLCLVAAHCMEQRL